MHGRHCRTLPETEERFTIVARFTFGSIDDDTSKLRGGKASTLNSQEWRERIEASLLCAHTANSKVHGKRTATASYTCLR